MKLTNVTIHKYKSFIKEQSFSVEDGITRIVGKNESGKSAILEAIAKTNYFEDDKQYEFNKTLDYPRNELMQIKESFPEAVTCCYRLDDDEIRQIENHFGKDILSSNSFKLTAGYDNAKTICGFGTNLDAYKRWLVKHFEIGDKGQDIINDSKDFTSLFEVLKSNGGISGFDKINKHLEELEAAGNDLANPLSCFIYRKFVLPNIPKMWYFDEYFNMPHRIDLDDFAKYLNNGGKESTDDDYKIINALFDLSGLTIDDLNNEDNFENFKAKIEATSNAITDEMFEYWTTNSNLEIKFDKEHKNDNKKFLNIRIYNTRHRVSLPLKNRSKGFLWFFSFLVWFSKIQNQEGNSYILLLDEPGLSLHASAQADLLRFIEEKLAPNYQVLYTTHSPFMIETNKLHEVRTVYDNQNPKTGSVISEAALERDSDTIFPLQAALGYSLAQNLYVSQKNLLVEGISDLTYLSYFSSILSESGREGLSEDISIIPIGGAEKVSTFISLMRGNKLSVVCLLDDFLNSKSKEKLQNVVKQKLIKDSNILYYSILGENIIDIEDVFSKQEYIGLFNASTGNNIPIEDLSDDKPILQQIKNLANAQRYNHFSPANHLLRMKRDDTAFSNETLDRFEKLFKEINKLF